MALSYADACPNTPHIEINDINIYNKRSRQKSSNSSDPSRQRRYKVRDLIPREIANIACVIDTRCNFTPAIKVITCI